MAQEKPRTTVELEPGIWLVDVHPKHQTRIWRFNGLGFEGHGSKLKRVQVVNAINELVAKAEQEEGIGE